MVLPYALQRKGKKLALSYEYVHDRMHFLPSYMERILLGSKIFLLIAAFLFLAFTADIWSTEIATFAKRFVPKPPPAVTIDTSARSMNLKFLVDQRAEWKQSIQNFSQQIQGAVHNIPAFVTAHPDLFELQVSSHLEDVRKFQVKHSHPVQGVSFHSARNARSFALPFTQNQMEFPSRLHAEIALLRQLKNFNATNIRQFLNKPDRRAAMEEFLLKGKDLSTSAERTFLNISARKNKSADEEERLQTAANAKESDFLNSLSAFAAQKTEEDLSDFISIKQRTVDARAESGFLTILEQNFANEINILRQRLDAVEKNKDPLIANVQFTSTPGIDLGLINN